MKITDNIEMLEIMGMGNTIYPTLAWDTENLVLIDTGFPGQADVIVNAIAAVGFSAEDISHIILTHQDIDHIGCAMDLLKLTPTAIILAHSDEAPYIDGRKTPIKLAAMLEHYDSFPEDSKAWCDKLAAGFANRKIHVSHTLFDGEILPVCGGIEVIHTPGHTPGHICLFMRESGILVGGDAVNIIDGKLTGPNPQHTFDMELGLQSMRKIEKYPKNALISYHCGYLGF